MGYVVGLLLVAGVLAFIGWPLLRREVAESDETFGAAPVAGPAAAGQELARREQDLARRKEQVLATLNELEYDFQMRKISPEDYRLLKARLIEEAASMFGKGDGVGAAVSPALEAAIEAQIAAAREEKPPTSGGRETT